MMVRATTRRVEFEHHMNEISTSDGDDPKLEVMLEAEMKECRGKLCNDMENEDCTRGADDKENTAGNSTSATCMRELAVTHTHSYRMQRALVVLDTGSSKIDAHQGKYSEQRSKRSAHFANLINNWGVESDKKLNVQPRNEAPVIKPIAKPASSRAIHKKIDKYEGRKRATGLNVTWNDTFLMNLEMEGFQRCDSEQHLVFDYKSPQKTPADCSRASALPKMNAKDPEPLELALSSSSPVKDSRSRSLCKHSPVQTRASTFRSASPIKFSNVSPSVSIAMTFLHDTIPVKDAASHYPRSEKTMSTVLDRAAKFEIETRLLKEPKDPTELSIQDRVAIFERNNGEVVIPKALFGMLDSAKISRAGHKSPERETLEVDGGQQHDTFNGKQSTDAYSVIERKQEIDLSRDFWKRNREENVLHGSQVLADSHRSPCTGRIQMGTRSSVRRERCSELSPSMLGGQHTPRKSSELVGSLSQIKVSPPKLCRLYPSVSDIDTECEAMDSTSRSDRHESDFDLLPQECQSGYSSGSDSSASFGQNVVTRVRLSQVKLNRGITTSSIRSTSSSSPVPLDTSAQEWRVLHEKDDFLGEALSDASPPKRLKDVSLPDQPLRQQDSLQYQPAMQVQLADKKLVHTVSFYRRLEAQRTPKQEIYADDKSEAAGVRNTTEKALVKDRTLELDREMIKQTTIIYQAAQALNLCHALPEFAGSLEQVEAEKLLLIATSRRAAALRELERLRIEKTLPRGVNGNVDKGNLTIEYISLPIKMCPIELDKTEYFMCLVTSGVTVAGTQVQALKKQNLSRGNRLAFIKPLTLENLFCDFTVTLEVYQLNCGNVGAGVKDKKLTSKLWLTPQKKSEVRSRHQRLPVRGPGGPNSIRSSSFKMVGSVIFSLRELRRNKFTLNEVPYGTPLDGTVELSMTSALNSEIEYRGFLTQFKEVRGFGAWKRNWALLKESSVTFWLYPEHEEQNRIPIDIFDLGTVKTREVKVVSRDVCARPHTFLLKTNCGEDKLLSADTLGDRLAWTRAINNSLQFLKS